MVRGGELEVRGNVAVNGVDGLVAVALFDGELMKRRCRHKLLGSVGEAAKGVGARRPGDGISSLRLYSSSNWKPRDWINPASFVHRTWWFRTIMSYGVSSKLRRELEMAQYSIAD